MGNISYFLHSLIDSDSKNALYDLSIEKELKYYAQYTTLNRCGTLVVQLLGDLSS